MSNSRFKWNQFGSLCSVKELANYMQREYDHSNYYHYTKLCVIDSILEKNQIWASCVKGVNDKTDKKQFGNVEQQREYYTLCFSTGVHENLPLWYLYSGKDGKGGRIRFTSQMVKKLIEESTYLLYESNGKALVGEPITLLPNKTFTYSFKDVLYCHQEQSNIALKYNTMTNYHISNSEFEELKREFKHFVKGLIWYYEKESRLVIHLENEAKKIIKNNPKNDYKVVIAFNDKLKKNISINLAPNIVDYKDEEIKKFKHIYSHIFDTSKVQLSMYKGEIDMKLD
ncbi:DUF2971 domain-containing protein [Ruminococcus sp. FC2018]|uniref:DUF2971 domain-containing protein n=1 Tax=Ruminococcus sp. FC2018 TaxID=1410617 RepID=UPI00048C4E07|nr:DUF2971 domain-containing protein [Ruminococcus sp. FC2018]